MTDELTGLRTHRDDLGSEIRSCLPLCCLVDIDGLIWLNDQHGHEAGDRVLRTIARQLEASVLEFSSTVFRVGGDEFLVLFRSLGHTAASDVAMKIVADVRALAIPYRRTDHPVRSVVEVNVAILSTAPPFAERAFFEYGLSCEARDWIGEAVYREKLRIRRDAGIVIDLVERPGRPWAS